MSVCLSVLLVCRHFYLFSTATTTRKYVPSLNFFGRLVCPHLTFFLLLILKVCVGLLLLSLYLLNGGVGGEGAGGLFFRIISFVVAAASDVHGPLLTSFR